MFDSVSSVVLPYAEASRLAVRRGVEPVKVDHELRGVPSRGGLDLGGRLPVCVLLGHFDHGKTTLLDALIGEGSSIAPSEAEGITQAWWGFRTNQVPNSASSESD